MSSKQNHHDSPDISGFAESGLGLELIDILVEQMANASRNGTPTTAFEILAAHPELDDEAAIRLIFEEVSLKREAGEKVPTVELLQRYPKYRDDLAPLLGFDKFLREPSHGEIASFPEVGQRIGDFQLLSELGRGASGRTFLAAQPSLADRPVVLKIMASNHSEHLSLAKLQHTHIVPLYWEQEFPELGLRGLLMPYLGGSNLAEVLDDLSKIPVDQRSGSDFIHSLNRLSDPMSLKSDNEEKRYQSFFGIASYDQLGCWIAVCLAEALHYAHDRDLIHMDVKPSNVLIAGYGQPMLLDFHLARSPVLPGRSVHDRLGGTPGWTSPEQRGAMQAVFEGRPVEVSVDGRSDIYALGLLLYEFLGGTWEIDQKEDFPRLSKYNPNVSTGLSDIVDRCLANNPADRYPTAASLAEDLRCHIEDKPLKGVPNRNPLERWRKWRLRSPHALVRGTARISVATAALAVIAIGWFTYNERIKGVRSRVDESQRLWSRSSYEEAYNAATEGLLLSNETPFLRPNLSELKELQQRAAWARSVTDLNSMADLIRFTYGAISDESAKIRALAPKLRQVWKEREKLIPRFDHSDPTSRRLREQLNRDFREIAVVWAYLRTEIEPRQTAAAEAHTILVEAEADFGTSPALIRTRRALAKQIHLPDDFPIKEPIAETAWEHYELGRLLLLSSKVADASKEFRESLDLHPTAFWSNFYDGLCAYRLGKYDDALAAFRVCQTLSPDLANVRVNRALAYEALGRLDDAYLENSKAIERNPELAEAYFNRGHVSYKTGRLKEAIADLRNALSRKTDRSTEARIRFVLACALRSSGDLAASQTEAVKAVKLGSEEAKALLPALPARPRS